MQLIYEIGRQHMVSLTTKDSTFSVTVELDPPNVYLDHCVIGDFARDKQLGEQFRQVLFAKHGTLCISALHLIELTGICPGPTYSTIRAYLSSFENRFAILEYEPGTLISRERGPMERRRSAPVDFDLTKALISHWKAKSPINIGILLDLLELHPDIVSAIREKHVTTKASTLDLLRQFRLIYRNNVLARRNADSRICPTLEESSAVEYVFCELRRQCLRQDLKESDIIDLWHSTVGASYAQFVVLDKKWARRVRNIPAAGGLARVFATNQYADFLSVLAA